MKKRIVFQGFIIVLFFLSLGGVYADFESRVAVLPLVSTDEDSRFGSVGSAIHDTVALTLKLLGKYDVIEDTGILQFSQEEIVPYSEKKNVDSVIFGSIQQDTDGTIVIEMSVWDRQTRKIVLDVEEKAEMLLDIFDASDRIVVALIEGFSNSHIGYGSIALRPEGKEDSYLIELNNTFVGMNKREIRNVLIGSYTLTIRQQRPFGSSTLFSGNIEVKEHEETSVSFMIPFVTKEESDFFNDLDKKIFSGWSDPDKKEELIKDLNEVQDALADYNGFFADERAKYKKWLVKIPFEGNSGNDLSSRPVEVKLAKENLPNVLSLVSAAPPVAGTHLAAGTYNAHRASHLDALEQNRIPMVKERAIKVDGKRNDWLTVPVVVSDRAGDCGYEEADIMSVKIVRDESSVYTLISMNSDSVYGKHEVWVQVFFNTVFGDIMLNCTNLGGNWAAYVGKWVQSEWKTYELAPGKMRKGSGFIEAAFPYSVLEEALGTGVEYLLRAQSGDSERQLDYSDSSATIILN